MVIAVIWAKGISGLALGGSIGGGGDQCYILGFLKFVVTLAIQEERG